MMEYSDASAENLSSESYTGESVNFTKASTKRLARTIKNIPPHLTKVFDVTVDDSRDDLLKSFSKATMKDRYLTEDESFQDRFANCVRYYANDQAHAQRLYDYISKLWCMPATPILSNGGTTKGNLISCFLGTMEDSLEGIQDTLTENFWMGAKGGGIGTYVGGVREIGAKVGTKGKTSGVMSFIKMMDAQVAGISQAGNRRGAGAVYMDISHPEIDAFLDMRKEAGGDPNRKAPNLHHGVCIDDKFMHAVKNDELYDLISPKDGRVVESVPARNIAAKLMETRMATGEPYLFFTDTINRSLPEHHRRSGLKVKTSNLCVAPETRILTNTGYKIIRDVADTEQYVWNGSQWSRAYVAKTGQNQKLVRVTLSNGVELDVTSYHKWKLQIGYGSRVDNHALVPTCDLQPGDRLVKPNFSVVTGGFTWDPEFAYRNGFYTADGTDDNKGKPRIYLYDKKMDLLSYFSEMNPLRVSHFENGGKRHVVYFNREDLLPKYTVPLDGDLWTKLSWLAGYLDGDGTVARNGVCEGLQATSTNKQFLMDVRLLLTTLGVDAKVALTRDEGRFQLPNGQGGLAWYQCAATYRIVITAGDAQRLLNLGVQFRRLQIARRETQRDAHQFVSVVSVVDHGRVDDTYCFNEPLEHLGVFEGVLTGNCAEITLPTGRDHLGNVRTAVCCLFQPNAEKFDEWKNDPLFYKDILYLLDNVLQDFIDNAGDKFINARYSAMRERSVGVGMMGFHSFLQARNIPFGSVMSKVWNKKIFSHHKQQLDQASVEIAEERGACPDAADHGIMERFSYKSALAPTASVSIICGGTSAGGDVIPANIYVQKTLDGSFEVKNPYLEKLLVEKGQDTRQVWNNIIANEGSVQHLDFLTPEEKEIYLTSFEVDPRWVIELAADRTPMIDQSQSLNIALPPDCEKYELWKIHELAWRLGVKTMYYLRSFSIQRISGKETKERKLYEGCMSCE